MKTSTKIFSTTILSLGLIGLVSACGHRGWCGHGPGHWHTGDHADEIVEIISDRLELTTDQTSKLGEVQNRFRALRDEIHEQRSTHRQEILALLTAPQLDRQKAMEMVVSRLRSIEQQTPEIIAVVADFSDSLSPDQKQQVEEFVTARSRRHGK
ncbi:MAG: periplasmic heavy metal sensor [Gammaproteobacteria bacterium]|nr:periplasmic heavy metal sensor [Gammaproteobacteria bacterium]